MIPKDQKLDRKEDSEEPLENQPLEWSEEDREMEDRSPDLCSVADLCHRERNHQGIGNVLIFPEPEFY